jgi:hypothetical protein
VPQQLEHGGLVAVIIPSYLIFEVDLAALFGLYLCT